MLLKEFFFCCTILYQAVVQFIELLLKFLWVISKVVIVQSEHLPTIDSHRNPMSDPSIKMLHCARYCSQYVNGPLFACRMPLSTAFPLSVFRFYCCGQFPAFLYFLVSGLFVYRDVVHYARRLSTGISIRRAQLINHHTEWFNSFILLAVSFVLRALSVSVTYLSEGFVYLLNFNYTAS